MSSVSVFQFRFPQNKPGRVDKMSKRKSNESTDTPTKRVRPVVGGENDDADENDSDQEDQLLSNQVIIVDILQNAVLLP